MMRIFAGSDSTAFKSCFEIEMCAQTVLALFKVLFSYFSANLLRKLKIELKLCRENIECIVIVLLYSSGIILKYNYVELVCMKNVKARTYKAPSTTEWFFDKKLVEQKRLGDNRDEKFKWKIICWVPGRHDNVSGDFSYSTESRDSKVFRLVVCLAIEMAQIKMAQKK